MRIVNLAQFLALPNETLFAKYTPSYLGDLAIKTGNVGDIDFCYQQIADAIDCTDSGDFGDKLDDAESDGISLAMDFNSTVRDGCFEEGQLFAVYERADVQAMIERLQVCLDAR